MKLGLRETIVFVLLLGMIGGSWQFGFKKIAENREALEASIAAKQKSIDSVQASNHNVGELEKEINRLESSISYFDAKLPREKDVKSMLESVWQIAQKYGLDAEKVRTLKVTRDANYNEQPIEISISGNFPGFYQFLQDVEQLARITRVSDMTLKKITDSASAMEAQVTLTIFFAPDASNP